MPRVKIVLAKLAGAIAVLAAALFLNVVASHAGLYGNFRWCAVTNQGSGALNWDCEYATAEDCARRCSPATAASAP